MHVILDRGVELILWCQQFSPTLDLPFQAVTLLGSEVFFLLFLPFVYWSLDRRTGARLTVLFLLSAWVNAMAKVLAAQPRPYQYDPQVRRLAKAGGPGLPSGHTQSTVVLWGYLAAQFRRPWLWVLAGALMVLVPLSRLYLGVHFPTDLLGGYLLGAVLLLLYLRLERPVEGWLLRGGLGRRLALAILPSALMLFLCRHAGAYPIKSAASLMGMGVGFVLERRWVGFETEGAWWKRGLRFLLGVAMLALLRVGLKAAFGALPSEALACFLRYLLMALGGAFVAPWIFVTWGLAERRPSNS